MMEMTGSSRGECWAVSDTIDKLLKTVQEAKASEDKARMKTALQQVEDQITSMKSRMGRCTDMMGIMQKMKGGMMGGSMMGLDTAKAGPKPKAGKFEESEHERHYPK